MVVDVFLAMTNASTVPAPGRTEFPFQINELSGLGAVRFAGGEGAKYTDSMQARPPIMRNRC